MTTVYRKRENFFEKSEREWRVEDDRLVCRKPDGKEPRLSWRDVTLVRLRAFPTAVKPWLHQFHLETPRARVTIDNCHFQGIASFEDRTSTYTPFVRAALARIAAESPNVRVQTGSTGTVFWGSLAVAGAGFAALATALLLVPMPAPPPLVVIVKLGVLIYAAAMLPRWIRANRPREATLEDACRTLP